MSLLCRIGPHKWPVEPWRRDLGREPPSVTFRCERCGETMRIRARHDDGVYSWYLPISPRAEEYRLP